MNWTNLPTEILLEQLLELSIEDLLQTCKVNQRINQICQEPILWYRLLQRDYPDAEIEDVSDSKLIYRKQHLLKYIIESYPDEAFDSDLSKNSEPFGFDDYRFFIMRQHAVVFDMDEEKLSLLERLRNEIIPMSRIYEDTAASIETFGFVFDAGNNLIFVPFFT